MTSQKKSGSQEKNEKNLSSTILVLRSILRNNDDEANSLNFIPLVLGTRIGMKCFATGQAHLAVGSSVFVCQKEIVNFRLFFGVLAYEPHLFHAVGSD